MISCFVYYRKAKKIMNEDQWEHIQYDLNQDSQIGANVGIAIPSLGVACGLITGTMQRIGLSALILNNEKAYKDQHWTPFVSVGNVGK